MFRCVVLRNCTVLSRLSRAMLHLCIGGGIQWTGPGAFQAVGRRVMPMSDSRGRIASAPRYFKIPYSKWRYPRPSMQQGDKVTVYATLDDAWRRWGKRVESGREKRRCPQHRYGGCSSRACASP